MGHQESYLRMKKSEDFDLLVKTIQDYGKDSFYIAEPVEVITLNNPIKGSLQQMCHPEIPYSFNQGEKFVYVTGDRGSQRSPHLFFESCKNVPDKVQSNVEIYFTECFPSQKIFGESGFATHEEFEWNAIK